MKCYFVESLHSDIFCGIPTLSKCETLCHIQTYWFSMVHVWWLHCKEGHFKEETCLLSTDCYKPILNMIQKVQLTFIL